MSAFGSLRDWSEGLSGGLIPRLRDLPRWLPFSLPHRLRWRDRGLPDKPPEERPHEKPFIARAPDWPPPPQRSLDLDEFALLPASVRATIAAILEPPLARLRSAVLDHLAESDGAGTRDQRVARAVAGDLAALAALIEAVDRYNETPGSTYRIDAALKSFLVECALGELVDSAHAVLAVQARRAAALAA